MLKRLSHHVNQFFLSFVLLNAFYGAVTYFLQKKKTPFSITVAFFLAVKVLLATPPYFLHKAFGSKKKLCNLSLLLLKPLSTSGINFFGEAPLLPKKTLNFLECLTLPHQRLNICGHDLLGPSYELQGSSDQFDVFQRVLQQPLDY